jgi:GTP cyclohydrolase I
MDTLCKKLLQAIGEDPARAGLKGTPRRFRESMQFLTSGYEQNLKTIVNGALFPADTEGMVIVKDIEMYSLCEHHLLPFYGKVHIGYIPDKKVIGLSKIPRIVDMFARRLQVQERMGQEICDALDDNPQAQGHRRDHRGEPPLHDDARRGETAQPAPSRAHVSGSFKRDARTREEFLQSDSRG